MTFHLDLAPFLPELARSIDQKGAAHDKFCARYGFEFPLLVDAEGEACKLFDVIHEKNMYGRKVLGLVRSTFLIDAAGKLRQEWRKVKVEGHAAAVLEAVESL